MNSAGDLPVTVPSTDGDGDSPFTRSYHPVMIMLRILGLIHFGIWLNLLAIATFN